MANIIIILAIAVMTFFSCNHIGATVLKNSECAGKNCNLCSGCQYCKK